MNYKYLIVTKKEKYLFKDFGEACIKCEVFSKLHIKYEMYGLDLFAISDF